MSLKIYTSTHKDKDEGKGDSQLVEELLEEEFHLKVGEELVQLVDQREHIKIITGRSMAVKLIMKWLYDSDVERLGELQAQQIAIEK